MPPENRLDLNKTFEAQKDLVKGVIIPAAKASIDLDTFPIVDGILYKMLHERHRHQRELSTLKE